MGFHAPILIASAFVLLGAAGGASAAESCVKCHAVHHADRGGCTACHRGDPRSDRPEIAHHDLVRARFAHFTVEGSAVTAEGQKALERLGCRRCHVTGGKGNRLATDLDRQLARTRPEEVQAALEKPALFMPNFALPERTSVALVNALLAGTASAKARPGEAPLVIHFDSGARQEHAFAKHCGRCHRVLTERWGGLGVGSVGPSLSGLFSPFYPRVYREGQPWSPRHVREWLENPRRSRPFARMPPLKLTDEDVREVESALSPSNVAGAESIPDGMSDAPVR